MYRCWSVRTIESGFFFLVLLSLVFIIFNTGYFQLPTVTTARSIWKYFSPQAQESEFQNPCIIPKLDPFDREIMKFIKTTKKYNCLKKYSLLFSSDELSNLLILRQNFHLRNYTQCCYSSFLRGKDADKKRTYSKTCYPIHINKRNKVQIKDEFIVVKCRGNHSKKYEEVDIFGFVHRKPKVESRISQFVQSHKNKSVDNGLNVVILGMDSLSRMNFLRTMNKSVTYLSKDLLAFPMNGYFSVGENSLPNFSAFLTGLSIKEIDMGCYNKTKHFDTCPFIWNNFSEKGYRTFFGEDTANVATFNYAKRKGFKKQPTDYYLQTLFYQMVNIRSKDFPDVSSCNGPRYVFEILLDYLKKTAAAFRKGEKYFQFMWTNAFHDEINSPAHADDFLVAFLKWFKKRNHFEITVVFLMSDHGLRYGGIRYTYQGKLEGKMPLLSAVFPKWFQNKYPLAISNFKRNSQRLTTPFDLHETFLDLSNYEERISQESIRRRIDDLSKSQSLQRGISLFLPIPKSRSCAQAGIPNRYCLCQYAKPIPVNSKQKALEAAHSVVKLINNHLVSATSKCAELILKKIESFSILKMANMRNMSTRVNSTREYLLILVTEPGHGTFEALVTLNKKREWNSGLIEDIHRINMYGNQSYCVQDRILKTFCYCKQSHHRESRSVKRHSMTR